MSDQGEGTELLAGTVKQFHAKLRADLKSGEKDADMLWREHLKDHSSLSNYATAMYALATGPWAKHKAQGEGGRIEWCVDVCCEYFLGGQLKKLLLKDLRRTEHGMPTLLHPMLLPPSPEQVEGVAREFEGRRWRLLDVGSCYNPFAEHSQFDVTAVDIAPAVESVWKCDFMSVDIAPEHKLVKWFNFGGPGALLSQSRTPPLEVMAGHPVNTEQSLTDTGIVSLQGIENKLLLSDLCPPSSPAHRPPRGRGHLDQLPEEWYDVVIFSLLLSYLPATKQRLQCCINAYKVLRPHGLLLIVTPDSSHQNRHAEMMKDWKYCIEGLGFHRWRYVKDTHLHCMAFRKTGGLISDYSHLAHTHALLSIPQDNQELGETREGGGEGGSEGVGSLDCLTELPFSGSVA